MFLLLFQIGNRNIPLQRGTDKHNKTTYNKCSLFMPRNNPTSFFFGFSSLPVGSQEAFLPAIKTLLLQVWAFYHYWLALHRIASVFAHRSDKETRTFGKSRAESSMHELSLVCSVLLPLGEQSPWTKCVFVPGRGPVAAMSQTPEQDIRGQHAHLLLPRFIQRQGKGKKPCPNAWGRKVSMPIPK